MAIDYRIIRGDTLDELRQQVKKMMLGGWLVTGGVVIETERVMVSPQQDLGTSVIPAQYVDSKIYLQSMFVQA